jgi:hypothetical protein
MKRFIVFVLALSSVFAVACSGKTPLNPSGNDTATLHLSVDGVTCRGSGPARLAIDGTNVGTVNPGDGGLTKDVGIGQHTVSGASVSGVGFVWNPFVLNVPAGGYTLTLTC